VFSAALEENTCRSALKSPDEDVPALRDTSSQSVDMSDMATCEQDLRAALAARSRHAQH